MPIVQSEYVHGYSGDEAARLKDQADTLYTLLYKDIVYPSGSKVLEAGCGTCSQTVHLAAAHPDASFFSIDISVESLAVGQEKLKRQGIKNVELQQASIFNLPFGKNTFDHVFVCFVLEHLADPVGALKCLKNMLKPDGTITVIEGDHGSAYYHPMSKDAQATIDCLIEYQRSLGGDSLIGRRLYPLLRSAGFEDCDVKPIAIYADHSKPEMEDGFTKKTFISMVEGIQTDAIGRGLIEKDQWDRGIAELKKTAGASGTFNYTFFRAKSKNT